MNIEVKQSKNRGKQQEILDYLREENRILHAQLGTRRLRFDDEQRRRLAVRAKLLGRRVLAQVATIVTPDALLRRHDKLIAEKYDGSAKRGPASVGVGYWLSVPTIFDLRRRCPSGVVSCSETARHLQSEFVPASSDFRIDTCAAYSCPLLLDLARRR